MLISILSRNQKPYSTRRFVEAAEPRIMASGCADEGPLGDTAS